MGLLITVFFAVKAVNKPHQSAEPKADQLFIINNLLLILTLAALITGSILVYPEHFTFHTHWILAAYALIILFGLNILLLMRLHQKHRKKQSPMTSLQIAIWRLMYIVLAIILIIIMHDAVSRATLLF